MPRAGEDAGPPVVARAVAPADLSPDERARWAALRAADPAYANPFLHPAFAEAVADSREGVEVAVLERDGTAVGFLAFQRDRSGKTAEPAGGTMADVQAAVVEPGLAWDPVAILETCGLAALEYDHMLADGPFAPWHEYEDDAPTIDLSGGYGALRERIEAAGSSVFRQIDRKARKLEREVGPIGFDYRAGADALAALVEWKSRRVRAQGFEDYLVEPWVARLVEAVAGREEPGFEGIVSVLTAGGRPVAAHLGVRGDTVLASWIPAFDPDLGRYSPGSILHAELCRAAAEDGIDRLDLGRGENRLKDRLSTGAVRLAVGGVERRPIRRALRRGRARLKQAVKASPLGEPLRRGLRRLRAIGKEIHG